MRGNRSHLKGSLHCGQCGSLIGLTNTRNRHGSIYPNFYCIGRQHKRTHCNQPYVPVETVEAKVADYYATIQLQPDAATTIRDVISEEIDRTRRLAARDVKRQEKRLSQLEHERRQLIHAHYAEAIPP